MRVAAMILSLVLMLVVLFQSCAGYVGGAITENKDLSGGGAVGIAVALCWLIGAAFVLGKPTIAFVFYAIAALLALMVGTTTQFADMNIWAAVSAVFAVLAFLGRREKRPKMQPEAG